MAIFSFKTFLHKNRNLFIIGLVLATITMIPYCILGTGSIVTYHDQLDGELMSYILTARYLFTGVHTYPELMMGLPANGAIPPAPVFVLLYKIFQPFIAFMITQWIINLIAFSGMFLFLNKVTSYQYPIIPFFVSLIFMLLPFYPVYGLSIPGQPYLCLAFFCLAWQTDFLSEKVSKKKLFSVTNCISFLIIFFYGISSSLTLVGFACLLAAGVFLCIMFWNYFRKKTSTPIPVLLGILVLLFSYLLTNISLILQIFIPSLGYVSHKSEYVISPENFIGSFKTAFLTGISYAQSFPKIIIFITILLILVSVILTFMKKSLPKYWKHILITFAIIILISLWYAFYHASYITNFRNSHGGIWLEFNLDRIAWLLPVCWCLLTAFCCNYILIFFQNIHKEKLQYFISRALLLIILGLWGAQVLMQSSLKPNLSKLAHVATGGDYYALDWSSFFADDIFSQIRDAIGKPQDSYHVLSIGIYPAAAAYNGFYCLDGYSNNYPVTYKHTFRKIMEGEMAKSDYITALFDNWGNRCYVTTAEQNNYYTFEKKWNSVIYDLDLNIYQLQQMDCQYIFSAAYLMNADEMGLTLLQDTPFETDGSWYHIYVYQVPVQ